MKFLVLTTIFILSFYAITDDSFAEPNKNDPNLQIVTPQSPISQATFSNNGVFATSDGIPQKCSQNCTGDNAASVLRGEDSNPETSTHSAGSTENTVQ